MAFRRLGKLQVDVVADTSAFTAGMNQVTSAVKVVQGALGGFSRFVGGAVSALGGIVSKVGALSAAIAGGGFAVLTARAFKATGELSKMSRQLGVTVADLARAKQASILAGEGTKAFDSRIQRLSSQLRNAGSRTAQFKTAIQEWVTEVAKGGGEADRFGLVVDDAFARMVERANVAAARLRQAFVGRFRQIAVAIAPFIEFAANQLTTFMNNGTTGAEIVDRAMRLLRDTIASVLELLTIGQRLWLEWKVAALDAIVGFTEALNPALSTFRTLRADAIDFWSQVLSGTKPSEVTFTMADELAGPNAKLTKLEIALVNARKQLNAIGEKPRWAEDFAKWWDELIDDARKNMDDFAAIMEPPKLKDFKLPGRELRLAPNIATGTQAAAQASFRAQQQQQGRSAEQALQTLVKHAGEERDRSEWRNGLLEILAHAAREKKIIQMGS